MNNKMKMYQITKTFYPKTITTSLTKSNTYLNKPGYHLPYKYNNPTHSQKYKGLFLKKDIYIQNLIHNHYVTNKKLIKNKTYVLKKKSSSIPKEIILNANFPLKETKNLFQIYLSRKDRKIFDENPFISKYGSFNFGVNNKNSNQKKIEIKLNKPKKNIFINFSNDTILNLNTINNERPKNKQVETIEVGINTLPIETNRSRRINLSENFRNKKLPFIKEIHNIKNIKSLNYDD